MDLKKPGFGGPNSGKLLKDTKGNEVNKDRKLKDFQNIVVRHDQFKNQVYDPTYKAMGGDLVHKQSNGKNPYSYKDSYDDMGIPVVVVNKKKSKSTNEGKCYSDFYSFIIESAKLDDTDCDCGNTGECTCDEKQQ